jgi:ribose 5-phosphate isomerase B
LPIQHGYPWLGLGEKAGSSGEDVKTFASQKVLRRKVDLRGKIARIRYPQSMKLVVASDHAGVALKQHVADKLKADGHEVADLGTDSPDPVDYPDYAEKVAHSVLRSEAERAILICGSGAGACVAANKFKGIRAATCHDSFSARQCVEDDNVNVLCLGARVIGPELAVDLVRDYVGAQFSGAERHRRRLGKVAAFENRFGQTP